MANRTTDPRYIIRPRLNNGIYEIFGLLGNEVFETNPMCYQLFSRSSLYGFEAQYNEHAFHSQNWPTLSHGFAHFAQQGRLGTNETIQDTPTYLQTEREVMVACTMSGPQGANGVNPTHGVQEPLDMTAHFYLMSTDWIPFYDPVTQGGCKDYFERPCVVPNDPSIISWANQPPMLDSDPHITIKMNIDNATTNASSGAANFANFWLRFKLDGKKYYGFGVKVSSNTASSYLRTGSLQPPPVNDSPTVYITDSATAEYNFTSCLILR